MRKIAKIDLNQSEIVRCLRASGASVYSTAAIGNGFPDICVGYRGCNYLFEIKVPKRKENLTIREIHFFDEWRGQVRTITTAEDALIIMGVL